MMVMVTVGDNFPPNIFTWQNKNKVITLCLPFKVFLDTYGLLGISVSGKETVYFLVFFCFLTTSSSIDTS